MWTYVAVPATGRTAHGPLGLPEVAGFRGGGGQGGWNIRILKK